MKTYILFLVLATAVTSCKKIQAGGNLDVIKIKPDVVRYSDESAPKPTYVAKPDSLKNLKPNLVEPDLEMKGNSKVAEAPAIAK